MTSRLTIGITTKNRPDALAACLASLEILRSLDPEVIVFDDGSDPPAEATRAPGALRVRFIRAATAPGYIVGRNRMVREAIAPAVLLLDDDTRVLTRQSIEGALTVLDNDARVGAIAFAQAETDGRAWPAGMQPSPAAYPCVVPSFIGFAHLLRRDVFLALGGYREAFEFYGEEKDFCLRMLDAGHQTVYLPDAGVAHIPDTASRSRTRYLRFVVRNDCLNALYNDPMPRVLWTVPARFFLYFRMRRGWRISDPWGWLWVAGQLAGPIARAPWRRAPVSGATIRTWRSLKLYPVRYPAGESRATTARPLTVSITTLNRPVAIERCIRSLASIHDLVDRAIVLDDASAPPLDAQRMKTVADEAGIVLEVIRNDVHGGTAAGKNRIARRARSPFLLSLDDDAFVVRDAAVRSALDVLQEDPQVAAVAFAQSDAQGKLYPAGQQPAAADTPCYVPAFIGFGCMIARDRLLDLGGYREAFGIHGEEREVCLRWLDRGLNVVYLPDAPVAHVADAANRDSRVYVRQVMRNDCLASMYNDPFFRAIQVIPYKLWSFVRMQAGLPGGDPGGLKWILGELVRSAPAVLRQRQPVRWRTLREWRRLRVISPSYRKAGPPSPGLRRAGASR